MHVRRKVFLLYSCLIFQIKSNNSNTKFISSIYRLYSDISSEFSCFYSLFFILLKLKGFTMDAPILIMVLSIGPIPRASTCTYTHKKYPDTRDRLPELCAIMFSPTKR